MSYDRNMQKLLDLAEILDEARDKLKLAGAVPGVQVSVTDRVAGAIREIDSALDALDVLLGSAARKAHRERPRAAHEEA